MTQPPTWTDIEHQQTDITLVLPVSDALRLKVLLPRLLQVFDEMGVRGPEDRASRRDAHAAIEGLLARLQEALIPFDVPQGQAHDQ